MKYLLYTILVPLFFCSCVSYKQVPYFSDLPTDSLVEESIENEKILKIQKNDILAITISSLNPEASAIFNLGTTSSIQGTTPSNIDPRITSNGFLVDSDGNIQLPIIGSLKVESMTVADARKMLQIRLSSFLKEPAVSLKIVNFRISILGDVLKPGVYPVNNEKISVSEALSLAGDLNITAIRKNVLLIREEKGKRKFVRLDLQKKDLFSSEYYYLQNNDVLYVQPGNAKYASVDASYRNVSLILSALSVIALLITNL